MIICFICIFLSFDNSKNFTTIEFKLKKNTAMVVGKSIVAYDKCLGMN